MGPSAWPRGWVGAGWSPGFPKARLHPQPQPGEPLPGLSPEVGKGRRRNSFSRETSDLLTLFRSSRVCYSCNFDLKTCLFTFYDIINLWRAGVIFL